MNDPGSARSGNLPTYIVDAHALYWWYTGDSLQLGPAAEAAFRLAESGQARVLGHHQGRIASPVKVR